jgi:hypothetical protein
MNHMLKKRELIQAGWKPGALANDEQGRRVEVLSNPWRDDTYGCFRILIRACPGEVTRLADLNALSLASNDEA